MKEHNQYTSQGAYADMLFKALDIPISSFSNVIKRFRAFREAKKYRKSHIVCCEWAGEVDL